MVTHLLIQKVRALEIAFIHLPKDLKSVAWLLCLRLRKKEVTRGLIVTREVMFILLQEPGYLALYIGETEACGLTLNERD